MKGDIEEGVKGDVEEGGEGGYRRTRETPTFGGVSLALRGSGAFGGVERNIKKIGAPWAPRLGRQITPPSATKKKNSGASSAPFRVLKT